MQEILSAKAAVEEHGPIVVATVEGLKTHLQVTANLDALRGRSCARATRENAQGVSGSQARTGENRREQHRGSTNYSSGEMHCLLNHIRKHIPVASAEWEAVLAQPQWKARNGASLKRKFRNMCIASKQAGTELAGATRWVQSMMTMKKRGEAKQEPSRCSTNEPPDIRRVPLDVPQQAVDPVVSYPARDVEQLLLCWSNVPGYSQIPLTTPQ
ncbi:hypothetical protein PC118_g18223 [Phytophthora cactorum]|uniref:Myb-like domain-containing protein n=1 Tax=Phytophthora cactorum TaxID=29920 RepID=A0A8T1AG55_9STRA|nr:hypothetical protein PC115_g22138 [Phytophthora cactorum]KAG2968097.1 hypothetical protein PC118_g18223 [Phytophthora cactorum]